MVQTSPPATMGGPPPTDELQSRRSPAGESVVCTAMGPLRQGR